MTGGEAPPPQFTFEMVTGTVPGDAISEARMVVEAVVEFGVVVGVGLVAP